MRPLWDLPASALCLFLCSFVSVDYLLERSCINYHESLNGEGRNRIEDILFWLM